MRCPNVDCTSQLERDEQYEEARELLEQALSLGPPSVYRATLYRDLCTCNTKLKRQEDALKLCKQHNSHDSGAHRTRVRSAKEWAEPKVKPEATPEAKPAEQGQENSRRGRRAQPRT